MPIKKNHMQGSNTFKCIAMLYRIYTSLLRPKNIDSSLRCKTALLKMHSLFWSYLLHNPLNTKLLTLEHIRHKQDSLKAKISDFM